MKVDSVIESNAKSLGFKEYTEVQQESFGPILAGKDVLARAPTGTGKTAAFLLPLLTRLQSGEEFKVLVLEPTRELVIQAANECRRLSKDTDIRAVAAYGGTSPRRQEDLIRAGSQIIFSTVSRARELLDKRILAAGDVKVLVLDEADRLFSQQFQEDAVHVAMQLPRNRQTLLFCVQMPARVLALANKVLKDFVEVKTGRTSGDTVSHYFVVTENKAKTLCDLLKKSPHRALIFCSTVESVKEVASALRFHGIREASVMHSDLKPEQRHSVARRFAAGEVNLLVCTDLTARGIHFDGVTRIYSFDLPANDDFYLHRAGRTGRMGKFGECVSLLLPTETGSYRKLLANFGISGARLA